MTEFEKEAASRRFFFRKENRVLARADFQKIYDQGQRYRKPLLHAFVLYHAENPSAPTRLGITATKKSGNAFHRNRGRRLVRESFRHALPDLKPGYSVVVNVMRDATSAAFSAVDEQLKQIFEQAGMYRRPGPDNF